MASEYCMHTASFLTRNKIYSLHSEGPITPNFESKFDPALYHWTEITGVCTH